MTNCHFLELQKYLSKIMSGISQPFWWITMGPYFYFSLWGRQTPGTFVVGQQIEESLSDFLPCEWLSVLQAVQQRADGVILSLSVHRSHSVPVRKLTFSEEVQDVPLDGNRISRTNPHTMIFLPNESYFKQLGLDASKKHNYTESQWWLIENMSFKSKKNQISTNWSPTLQWHNLDNT